LEWKEEENNEDTKKSRVKLTYLSVKQIRVVVHIVSQQISLRSNQKTIITQPGVQHSRS